MQTAAQFPSQTSVAGFKLMGMENPATGQIVGANAVWRKLLTQAEMVAPHLQLAVIEGEHGAGKQTLAQYLHSRSPLARTNFQRYDAREWLVTEADPATLTGFLYLDRVDLLAAPGQGLLLRVLKALQGRPAGRVMLVASSQTSLRQMVGKGQMMPDLAFRLSAVRFAIPPLRQRKEDIAPLAQTLLERICARYQQRPVALGPGALARLLEHDWPGNVHELASVLEAALLEAGTGILHTEDLPIAIEPELRQEPKPAPGTVCLTLDAMIQRHTQHVLELNHGNKLRAARQLGISRSTLYRILGGEAVPAH